MRKYLVWIMMGLLVFSSLNSGCGRSSSSGGSSTQEGNGGTEQEQQQQQGTPTTSNTPTSQDSTPTSQDNTATQISFSVLTGTWTPSNGTGTATGGGVNATLTLKGGQVALTNANNSGTVQVFSNIYWDAVQGSSTILSDVRDNFGGSGTKTFTNVSGNTWRYSDTDSDGPQSTTITLTSAATANVERDGYYSDDNLSGVHFHMTYTITKQ